MTVSFEKERRARAVLAWLLACLVGGLSLSAPFAVPIMISDATIYGSGHFSAGLVLALAVIIYTLVLTAIPAIVLVNLVRLFGWRRGIADAAVPAGISFALTTLLVAGNGDQPVGWLPFLIASVAGISGLTYWLLAGRPRPPY
ncbi:hypothetical protein [Maricaulis salignorans]|uniref:Uncharacterized protein n=1 Tax=Maricaulis salignorans TaxID=144026 RepID=A0A1G9PY18_9PROT|nr:hypothetical protein [Maricaulis salignorans]SDM03666.1 hypothetical protein SAMN04488568_10482 [Maricaulis salignorans]